MTSARSARTLVPFVAIGAAALAIAIAPSIARAAPVPTVAQELEQAEQALVGLEYDVANKLAQRLAQSRGLTHEQIVRTYRVLALTDAVLDRETQARDAFVALLTYDPNYRGDPNLGPKVQGPFMEARGIIRAQAVQPGVEVSVVLRPSEPGTIRVTTRDPTHVARRAIVGERWGGEGTFTTVPIAIGEGVTATVPPPPTGTTRLDWYVQVLDDRDSVVFEAGHPLGPKSATVDVASAPAIAATPRAPAHESEATRESSQSGGSIFASPIFWVVAGAVVAGTATTVYFATRSSSTHEDPTSATLSPALTCGGGKC